jgi:hypothetical protein
LGEYSQCGSNAIGTSSTFSFLMCKLEKKSKIWENLPKFGWFAQTKAKGIKTIILKERNFFNKPLHNKKLHKNSML